LEPTQLKVCLFSPETLLQPVTQQFSLGQQRLETPSPPVMPWLRARLAKRQWQATRLSR
jgi:hypothetical protein